MLGEKGLYMYELQYLLQHQLQVLIQNIPLVC